MRILILFALFHIVSSFEYTASGVHLYDDDSFVMIEETRGGHKALNFIGGKKEPYETDQYDTMIREYFEETSYTFPLESTFVKSCYIPWNGFVLNSFKVLSKYYYPLKDNIKILHFRDLSPDNQFFHNFTKKMITACF